MAYIHNGLKFLFIERHFSYDLYGAGPLRIVVDRNSNRVIGDFMVGKAPDTVGNKKRKV